MTRVDHVTKFGNRTIDEYRLIVGGVEVATSHRVHVPSDRWTLVKGGKWAGMVTGRHEVERALLRLAA